MQRWNFLVLLAAAIVCYCGVSESNAAAVAPVDDDVQNIGVRALPAHDSEAMVEFKRGLDEEEKNLLKRHLSKTRFIQPLMDSSKVKLNRRKQLEVVSKRSEESESCCSCSPDSVGCYHPDDVKRSNIIRCCISPAAESVAVSERGVQSNSAADLNKALSGLSPEDQELLKKHMSKINNLIESETRPESSGNSDKREQKDEADVDKRKVQISSAEMEALDGLSQEDKDLLQKYISKIDNLVEAEHRPESNGNTEKRDHEDDAESVEKKDTGAVIQKLYDQLEGLKQAVGELKQQQMEKKSLEDKEKRSSHSKSKDLDEISQRFLSDVNLAKQKGLNINDLLEAIRTRALKKTKD